MITGESNLPVSLSACCKPHYPQAILGYVTRGKTIRVHQKSCRELNDIDSARLLEASWFIEALPRYQVQLRMESMDRVGLLKDIVNAVADLAISILDFPLVERHEGHVVRDLIVEISDYDLLAKLIYRLEKIENVMSVRKV